jgi:ribonuclease Z
MSCVAIELDDKKVWLVDCGAGTQQQMLKANIWIGRVEKVFITHLHGDHCYDIVGILALRSMRQIDTPLEVVGPVGIKEMIQTVRFLFPIARIWEN